MSRWIKIETTTPDKPEIIAAANICGVTQEAAFLAFFRLWAYFDAHCNNGFISHLSAAHLDGIAGVMGYGRAMVEVGWIVEDHMGIAIANWERHNGNSAKSRAQTMRRVQSYRAKHRWDPRQKPQES